MAKYWLIWEVGSAKWPNKMGSAKWPNKMYLTCALPPQQQIGINPWIQLSLRKPWDIKMLWNSGIAHGWEEPLWEDRPQSGSWLTKHGPSYRPGNNYEDVAVAPFGFSSVTSTICHETQEESSPPEHWITDIQNLVLVVDPKVVYELAPAPLGQMNQHWLR